MANVKYQGNSFEEWWKAHYGADYNGTAPLSKGANMSDADYSIGQKLYNSYLNEQDITNKYDTSKQTLAQNKRDAEIAADVSYQRLQKYLPQQLAKQGLYGTGMSEDAYLKLHNNYQKDIADIGKNYNNNLTTLENAYRTDINDERRAVGTEVEGVIDKYKAEELAAEERRKADEDRTKNNQLAMYNEAKSGLIEGYFKKIAEVDEYLNTYVDKVSDTQMAYLRNLAQERKADVQSVLAEKYKVKESYYDADKEVPNLDYVLADDEIRELAVEMGLENGQMFTFNGITYFKDNGLVYKLEVKPVNPDWWPIS